MSYHQEFNPIVAEQMFVRGCAPGIFEAKLAKGDPIDSAYLAKTVKALSQAWRETYPRQQSQQSQQDPTVGRAVARVAEGAANVDPGLYEKWKHYKVPLVKRSYGGDPPTWEQLVYDQATKDLHFVAKCDVGQPGSQYYDKNLRQRAQALHCLELVKRSVKPYTPPQEEPQGEPVDILGNDDKPLPWEGSDMDDTPF